MNIAMRIVLCLILLGLVGCGGRATEPNSTAPDGPAATEEERERRFMEWADKHARPADEVLRDFKEQVEREREPESK